MPPGPASAVESVDSARRFSRSAFGDRVDAFASETEVLTADTALADRPLLVALIVIGWMVVGFIGAAVMARRGHDFRPLAGLAVVFGPLFAGFVVANLRPRERGTTAVVIRPPTEFGGDQRVAILIVGDTAAIAAAGDIIDEAPGTVGQVEIIRPITYETADGSGDKADRNQAVAELHAADEALTDYRGGLTLLPGTTAKALSAHIDHTDPNLVLIVGAPGLESKLDHRTDENVRVVSVPASRAL